MRNSTVPAATIVAVVVLIGVLLSYFVPRYANAVGAECHTATPAEVEAGALPGRPVCPADAAAGITNDAGLAKQYLRSILCPPDGDNYGGMGPDGTIKGLDEKFAVCAAKFLKSARDNGTNVCVREGARSVDKQNEYVRRGVLACKRGAQCEHPRGLAIDVNVRPNINSCASYTNLHSAAPQFGLDFYLKCSDAYHFRPTSAGCNAGGVVPPPGSGSLSDQIRQALGMQPPPPPQPPMQPQPTLPEQPTLPAQSPSSTAQKPTPISDVININTNDNTNTRSTSSPTSTIDLIKEFLNPVSDSIDIGKAVDIDLNPDTSDATSLDAKRPTSTRVSATSSTYGNLSVPQTFTTGDLSKGPVAGYMVGENTFVLRLLDAMKNTLLLALSYLRPFGGYSQSQFYGE
ncbi:MAG: hypothetical protein Q7R90_00475 [bacterium]|nr:hypothetical protein [bacterium]